jgi:hypothetical protein
VKCNAFKKIVELDIGYIEADGLIPREIGLLKDLTDLDLHGNELQGVLPHKVRSDSVLPKEWVCYDSN